MEEKYREKSSIERVRTNAPCKDCRYRHIACHDSCFMYKEWKGQLEVIKNMKKRNDKTLEDLMGVLKGPKGRKSKR